MTPGQEMYKRDSHNWALDTVPLHSGPPYSAGRYYFYFFFLFPPFFLAQTQSAEPLISPYTSGIFLVFPIFNKCEGLPLFVLVSFSSWIET